MVSNDQKKEFIQILSDLYNNIKPQSSTLVLRDYHVDNLFYLNNQKSLRQVGLIDFQDAVIGSPLYDLASLLDDVRRPLKSNLKKKLLELQLSKSGNVVNETLQKQIEFINEQIDAFKSSATAMAMAEAGKQRLIAQSKEYQDTLKDEMKRLAELEKANQKFITGSEQLSNQRGTRNTTTVIDMTDKSDKSDKRTTYTGQSLMHNNNSPAAADGFF